MNLIKSFNFNFLKQNIRKSKGAIILSLIIIPLFLSMYLVVAGIETKNQEIVPVDVIACIDMFFMYIIPFVFSGILFGFVFKKSSTDFMNSIPINRKTMFVTNTIGGILLITVIQLLSVFFALLWGAVFKNIIVFPMAVLDTMVVSWISYVFVFTASNLAMTFSGTQKTQFVATVLILFLIPVCFELITNIRIANSYNDYYGSVQYDYDLSIANGYQTTYFDTLSYVKNYTMPIKLIMYGFHFSWITNLKMLVLSVIFFVLGLILYQKRKMEFSEESFGSQKLHILIKILTLIPILLFVNMLNAYSDSIIPLVIAIILCAVYYFLFDIIVKRKVPAKATIISFASAVFVIQAMIVFVGNIDYKKLDIDAEDIKSISIGKNSNSTYRYYLSNNDCFDGDYFIKNSQILDLILDGRNKLVNYDYRDNDYDELYIGKDIYFNIKLKNGKEYYLETTIAKQNYNEIVSILSRDKGYVNNLKKQIKSLNGVIKVGNYVVDNKTKKKIEKSIVDNLEEMNLVSVNENSVYYIAKTVYRNHRVVEYKISLKENDELFAIVAEFANRRTLENIKGYKYGISVGVYDKNENIGSYYDNNEILDFIEKHSEDEFDPSKKYYILNGGLTTRKGYRNFIFYTNSTKELDKIIER